MMESPTGRGLRRSLRFCFIPALDFPPAMKRRSLLLLSLVALLPSIAWAQEPDEVKPNILFISVDDLNDWIGPNGGHPQVKTPNLDKLAARGVAFTNAHCQSPLCNPSRTSVLTGRRPSTTGVYALNPWFRTDPLWRNIVTLPQFFMNHGYRTLTTGKTFHDAYPPKEELEKEFTVWGYHGGGSPKPPEKFVKGLEHAAMDWGVWPKTDEETDDYKVATWAIDQLKAKQKEPFMLCVGFRHPHVPCYAPQKYFDPYPEDKLTLPPLKADDRNDTPPFAWNLHYKLPEPRLKFLEDNKQLMPLVRSYLASISFVDAQIGRVLDALDGAGIADRTVVVLWSDHGWHLGEKGITGKNTLWDRSTRVPLIFAGPGVTKGAKCTRPVELLDIYPTLVELCKFPAPTTLEGHSLVPLLENTKGPRPFPAITTHGPHNHTVRTELYRYIRYADGSEEFYNLQKDPNEWDNIIGDMNEAKRIDDHRQRLPAVNAYPVAGSKTRLITFDGKTATWEGTPIDPKAPIPGP